MKKNMAIVIVVFTSIICNDLSNCSNRKVTLYKQPNRVNVKSVNALLSQTLAKNTLKKNEQLNEIPNKKKKISWEKIAIISGCAIISVTIFGVTAYFFKRRFCPDFSFKNIFARQNSATQVDAIGGQHDKPNEPKTSASEEECRLKEKEQSYRRKAIYLKLKEKEEEARKAEEERKKAEADRKSEEARKAEEERKSEEERKKEEEHKLKEKEELPQLQPERQKPEGETKLEHKKEEEHKLKKEPKSWYETALERKKNDDKEALIIANIIAKRRQKKKEEDKLLDEKLKNMPKKEINLRCLYLPWVDYIPRHG